MAISIAYSVDARRMLDAADDRWIAEHGVAPDNPLLDEIEHAGELLRENPELGIVVHHRGRLRTTSRSRARCRRWGDINTALVKRRTEAAAQNRG